MRARRLAIIVSHPIQYYAPLYKRLAIRHDINIKVFFTWHGGDQQQLDTGFEQDVRWDIPLTDGFDFHVVPNISSDPGTHHFFGLNNPKLSSEVLSWKPDAVHVTGWAWYSHATAMREFRSRNIPVLFRGDSHLLDSPRSGIKWRIKLAVLRQVFSWPSAFLYVGQANRAYYKAFGVEDRRLFYCPHSIDVKRFEGTTDQVARAANWRRELSIDDHQLVLLYAGKFQRKKQPIELMRALQSLSDLDAVLVMVGAGELAHEVERVAAKQPRRFRMLPFQNQSLMPAVYRIGDLFVLPSAFGETWGLAVNEAMAAGRPAIVSDRVGCAADIIDESCGRIFAWNDFTRFERVVREIATSPGKLQSMSQAAVHKARLFDIEQTEVTLVNCLEKILTQ